MREITDYQNKKVLVLGLAKSGLNAARLLHRLGAYVTVNDIKNFDDNPDAQSLVEEGVRVISGSHPVALLNQNSPTRFPKLNGLRSLGRTVRPRRQRSLG